MSISIPFFFEKLKTELHYSNEEVEFEQVSKADRGVANRNESIVGAKLSSALISWLPKMYFELKYDFGQNNFEEDRNKNEELINSDSHFHDIRGGITWQGTGKTSITFDAGFRNRDYNVTTAEDFKGFVTSLSANIEDIIVPLPSIFRFKLDNLNISAGRRQIEASFTQNFIEAENEINSSFTETNEIKMRLRKDIPGFLFVDEISFSPKASYNRTRNSGKVVVGTEIDPSGFVRRRDEIWEAGAAVQFVLNKYSAFEIRYDHRDRDSNNDAEDNRVNLLTFGVGFSY